MKLKIFITNVFLFLINKIFKWFINVTFEIFARDSIAVIKFKVNEYTKLNSLPFLANSAVQVYSFNHLYQPEAAFQREKLQKTSQENIHSFVLCFFFFYIFSFRYLIWIYIHCHVIVSTLFVWNKIWFLFFNFSCGTVLVWVLIFLNIKIRRDIEEILPIIITLITFRFFVLLFFLLFSWKILNVFQFVCDKS